MGEVEVLEGTDQLKCVNRGDGVTVVVVAVATKRKNQF